MKRLSILLALGMVLAGAPVAATADADATLSSGDDQVLWSGVVDGTTGAVAIPEACIALACSEQSLTLALPADTFATSGGVQVSIRWDDESQDLDLFVYDSTGSVVAKSEGPVSTSESALLRAPANGVFRVVVVPTSAANVAFEGSAEVEHPVDPLPTRELKPDMISLPARNLRFETSAYVFHLPVPSIPTGCYPEETVEQGAMKCLRFDQIIANVGHGPFELRYRIDGVAQEETRDLVQRLYSSDGSYRERVADTYTFHATHAHFHYENFAQSHLWRSNENGERLGTEPARSGRKNGFCMVDVEQMNIRARGDAARTYIPPGCLAPTEFDPATGALSAISGISVGWADVYNWYLPDQFIEVSGLSDGYYILENIADQAGTVEELDETNNGASVLIRLCGDRAEIVGGAGAC